MPKHQISKFVPEGSVATVELRNLFSSHRAAVCPLIVNHCQNCQTPGKSACGLDRHWKPFISRSNTNEHYLKSWIIYVYLFWQKLETNFESVWYQRTCTPLSKIFLVNNLRCAYCTTYYTVIAKAETFTEDLR